MDFLRTSRTFLLTLVPLPSSDTCISHTRVSLLNLNCGLLNYRVFVSVRTHSALPDQAAKEAKAAFHAVFEHGPRIEFDHQLVYQSHYELGRLLACQDDTAGATKHFDLVLSGKHLEVGPSGRKGKYSLENALHMRTHAALEALHQKRL
ncbi:hypothetical protein EV361DRAFT_270699 [Lentinula raphanica]|nr:hypothetical protein EV361DRAFT_270699 [Lentinula raphanica]